MTQVEVEEPRRLSDVRALRSHASNVHWQSLEVTAKSRAALNGNHPCVLWFTGLSGACQIGLTINAFSTGIDIQGIPAEYNAANDLLHLHHNNVPADKIRVLHYLRMDEINRSEIFLPGRPMDVFLSRTLSNPANIVLQQLVRAYRDALVSGQF